MDDMQHDFFEIIKIEVKNNHLSHAYLIETNNFTNIDQFINRFVKIILCPNKIEGEACNSCDICNLIDSGNFPDLKIIDTDSSVIKKEELVNLKKDFSNSSLYLQKQVYVIRDASKLNSSSGNTILKFLEDPSSNVVAILLTKNRYNVLETILSRCQVFSLKDEDILEIDDNILHLMEIVFQKNNILSISEILQILPKRDNFVEKFRIIQNYLFDIINDKHIVKEINNLNISKEKITKLILIIEEYLGKMKYNINYKLGLLNLLISISEVI